MLKCYYLFNFQEFFKSGHTNNWAVLVDTSRFWFNYRHMANVLSIYHSVKRLGIPDRHEHDFLLSLYIMNMIEFLNNDKEYVACKLLSVVLY